MLLYVADYAINQMTVYFLAKDYFTDMFAAV